MATGVTWTDNDSVRRLPHAVHLHPFTNPLAVTIRYTRYDNQSRASPKLNENDNPRGPALVHRVMRKQISS